MPDERDLRISYNMCFKMAGDIVSSIGVFDKDTPAEDIVDTVDELAGLLANRLETRTKEYLSHHSYDEAPSRFASTSKRSGFSGKGGSSRSGNPNAPATEKQVRFAQRLFWSKEHGLDLDPDSFAEMTRSEISRVIDQLKEA